MVLMSDWWVQARWGRAFEIVEVVPRSTIGGWAVMRKRDVELTLEDLQAPADDPREWAALRHDLKQVQWEVEAAKKQAAEDRDGLRRRSEHSASWRITRPLRAASHRLGAWRAARRG